MEENTKTEIIELVRASGLYEEEQIQSLIDFNDLPDETEVNDYKLLELSPVFLKFEDDGKQLEKELLLLAKKAIYSEDIKTAWTILLTYND